MPDSLKINPTVIKHLRKKEKMSQVALAAAIGISDRGVQKTEASGNTSSETAEKLALYFGLSVNDLMEGNIHCKAEYWAKDPVTGEHLIFSYANNMLEKFKSSWADYRRYFYSEEKVTINVQINKGVFSGHSVTTETTVTACPPVFLTKFTVVGVKPVTHCLSQISIKHGGV